MNTPSKKPAVKMGFELFMTEKPEAKWIESFYEGGWNSTEDIKFTEFEKELLEELQSFLPRHMHYYDWNKPYAQAVIFIIRNLLNGKKLING